MGRWRSRGPTPRRQRGCLPTPRRRAGRVWGLTPEERLRRTLRAAGCTQIESFDEAAAPPAVAAGSVLLLRCDYVFDERLVRALPDAPGTLLVAPDGVGVAAHVAAERAAETARGLANGAAAGALGLRALAPSDLVSPYTAASARSSRPICSRRAPSTRARSNRAPSRRLTRVSRI